MTIAIIIIIFCVCVCVLLLLLFFSPSVLHHRFAIAARHIKDFRMFFECCYGGPDCQLTSVPQIALAAHAKRSKLGLPLFTFRLKRVNVI